MEKIKKRVVEHYPIKKLQLWTTSLGVSL